MAPTTPPSAQALTLIAADGYRLQAMHYATAGAPRARIVIGGATGVPQRFYRRFAEHAAAQGFATLTLDYRGIGLSKPATLVGFEMDYLDWGRLDLAAAVEHMASGELPLFLVGHSYGGQALGLLPNHQKVSGLYTFGTGAGWHGWMPPLERVEGRRSELGAAGGYYCVSKAPGLDLVCDGSGEWHSVAEWAVGDCVRSQPGRCIAPVFACDLQRRPWGELEVGRERGS